MHDGPMLWVKTYVEQNGPFRCVVELGSLDINGTPRKLFGDCEYVGVDLQTGPNVDVIADAGWWQPDFEVDCVVSTEVLEHAKDWPHICRNAWAMLRKPGGVFIVTCATNPRGPHSGRRENVPDVDEWYRNVSQSELGGILESLFETVVYSTENTGDLYAYAVTGSPLKDQP